MRRLPRASVIVDNAQIGVILWAMERREQDVQAPASILEQAPPELAVETLAALEPEARRVTLAAAVAKRALGAVLDEYLLAANYYVDRGAQVPSEAYGGSRSMVYRQMIGRATTLAEIFEARRAYRDCHQSEVSNHDELGGVLRIAGYRLRGVPGLGHWLERKVRADDPVMAEAPFDYPDDVQRVSGRIRP